MGLLTAYCAVFAVTASTDDSTKTAPAPVSKAKIFITNNSWDWGYTPKVPKISHIFQIKNIGEDTLRITRVAPSWGCTSAPLKKGALAPGESEDLEVTLNSSHTIGKVNKSVTITSNDPVNPSVTLNFTANVGSESPTIKITPVEVLYDSIQVGKSDIQKIVLSNTDITKINLSLIEKPTEVVDIDIKKSNLEPGKSTEIIFRIDKKATPGYFNLYSTLEVNGSDKYRVTIPITGTLVAKWNTQLL